MNGARFEQKLLNMTTIRSFLAIGNYVWKKTNGNRHDLVPISELVDKIEYNDNVTLDEWKIRRSVDIGILANVLRYNDAADKVALDDIELAKKYFELQPGANYPTPFPCPRCHRPMNYIILENPPGNHDPKTAIRSYSCENVLCGFHENDPFAS